MAAIRRSRLIPATAGVALLLLIAVPSSTADDGRDPGAIPGPISPVEDLDGFPKDGPDSDDAEAEPIGFEQVDDVAAYADGRHPDAAPAMVTGSSVSPEPAADSAAADDDRDDPAAPPAAIGRETPGTSVDDGRG